MNNEKKKKKKTKKKGKVIKKDELLPVKDINNVKLKSNIQRTYDELKNNENNYNYSYNSNNKFYDYNEVSNLQETVGIQNNYVTLRTYPELNNVHKEKTEQGFRIKKICEIEDHILQRNTNPRDV